MKEESARPVECLSAILKLFSLMIFKGGGGGGGGSVRGQLTRGNCFVETLILIVIVVGSVSLKVADKSLYYPGRLLLELS